MMILLRQKLYSKPDSEKSVNLGGTRTKYSGMSEKQLKNMANYEEYKAEKKSTARGRRDNRKIEARGIIGFAGTGGMVGALAGKSIAGAGIGMLSGLGTWELIKIAADASHKKHARLAKEELKRRGINDWKTGKTLKERNKEVLEELEDR